MARDSFLKWVLVVALGCGILFFLQNSEWLSFQTSQPGLREVPLMKPEDDYTEDDTTTKDLPLDESDNDDDPNLVAPRSHDGPYDEYIPGRRYLIYNPSGGFSNQRMELEYAVEIGKLLNRTVYVPMCGRHTNGWMAYNLLKEGEDLFPMDRIIDFPFITGYDHRTRLAPLNITVSRFVGRFQKKYGPESVLLMSGSANFYGREQVIKWRQYKQPLIFFRGPGFFHPWFPQAQMADVRKRIRFTKYLRDLAIAVTRAGLSETFYAMHIRMGDYAYKRTGDGTLYLNRATDLKWKTKMYKTYIATEPRRDPQYFQPLEKGLNVVYSENLPKDLVRNFKNAFPKGKIRNDMLGLLEQLICVQAKSFIGSYFSTFSGYIMYMREHKAELFPELVNLDISNDGNAGEDHSTENPDQPQDDGTLDVNKRESVEHVDENQSDDKQN